MSWEIEKQDPRADDGFKIEEVKVVSASSTRVVVTIIVC